MLLTLPVVDINAEKNLQKIGEGERHSNIGEKRKKN